MKLKKGIVVEEAYQEIKKMIYFNMLAPGQKIVYQDLAQRLNISVTPVIQALNRLQLSNFVYYKPNRGYFVGEITETEAEGLYQAREALETYIVPIVIEKLKLNKVDNLIKVFKESKDVIVQKNGRALMIEDAEFHLKIAEYAENRIIYNFLKEIFEHIYLRYRPEYLTGERVKEAIREHREILISLEKDDPERSIYLFKKHIKNNLFHIIEHLKRNKEIVFK